MSIVYDGDVSWGGYGSVVIYEGAGSEDCEALVGLLRRLFSHVMAATSRLAVG
jgi:hypothetical protein